MYMGPRSRVSHRAGWVLYINVQSHNAVCYFVYSLYRSLVAQVRLLYITHSCTRWVSQESGGTVTDLRGEALDFSSEAHKSSRGAKLSPKVEGIVATGSALKAWPLAEGSGKGNGDDELSAHAELLLALDYATKPSGASGDARG